MSDLVEQAEHEKMRQVLRNLQSVSMLPGCADKRFVNNVWERDPATLTAKQAAHVIRLSWRYRRNMPKHLVPARDPDGLSGPGATR